MYHFYPRKEDSPGYQVDAPQQLCKTLGKYEDVPIEKLASTIMMQLARRDIMVYDVEIMEFVKRPVSYRETKGGILIKNKKFMLDGSIIEETEQPSEPEPTPTPVVKQQPKDRALRFEVFDPDPAIASTLLKKFKLTPKHRYAILAEKTVLQKVNIPGAGSTELPGYEYVVIDDVGQKVKVPSMNFVPEQKPLIGMENVRNDNPQLSYTGEQFDMPVLRR